MKISSKRRKETNDKIVNMMSIRPKRPELESYERRLETFVNWPLQFFSKEEIAEAGFFYTGDSDCTRCYCCGGAVRNWQPEDDIWLEHARWFPCCPFIEENVEKEIIDIVCNMHKNKEKITRITVNNEQQRLQLSQNQNRSIYDMDTSSD